MRGFAKSLAGMFLAGAAVPAAIGGGDDAYVADRGWSASIMGFYVWEDSDRNDVDYGSGLRLGLLYPVRDWLTVETAAFGNALVRKRDSGSHYQYGAGVDGLFHTGTDDVRPYLVAGGGALYTDFDGGSDTGGYLNLGGGLLFPGLWRSVSLRIELRSFHDFTDDGSGNDRFDDLRGFIGVSIPLYRQPDPPAQIVEITRPTRVIERERPPSGPSVARPGLPEERVVTFAEDGANVLFGLDSTELDQNGREQLRRRVVEPLLEDYPRARVRVEGHTCDVGNPTYNQGLSRRRAEAVRDFLVEAGIAPGRITTRGYGEDRPVASNTSEEGRRQNRRIEVHFISGDD